MASLWGSLWGADGRRSAAYPDTGTPLAYGNQTQCDGIRQNRQALPREGPDSAGARLRCQETSSHGRRGLQMDLGQPDGVNVAEELARDRTSRSSTVDHHATAFPSQERPADRCREQHRPDPYIPPTSMDEVFGRSRAGCPFAL